jgi:hypothetical protein
MVWPIHPGETFHATAGPRESLHKHLTASVGALGEGIPSLLLRAGGAIKRRRER